MGEDDLTAARRIAAAVIVHQKLLVMVTSFLIGAGVLKIDVLQDALMAEIKKERRAGGGLYGAAVIAELERLAKLFDPSILDDDEGAPT
jgi:hypothetical protein